jgi:hypothetical protein
MTRMIGRSLPHESEQELELIATEDQYLAQEGYVQLKRGEKLWYKHIEEMTPQDRPARLEYEKALVGWLKIRLRGQKVPIPEFLRIK